MSLATVAPPVEPWKARQDLLEAYVTAQFAGLGAMVQSLTARIAGLTARMEALEEWAAGEPAGQRQGDIDNGLPVAVGSGVPGG